MEGYGWWIYGGPWMVSVVMIRVVMKIWWHFGWRMVKNDFQIGRWSWLIVVIKTYLMDVWWRLKEFQDCRCQTASVLVRNGWDTGSVNHDKFKTMNELLILVKILLILVDQNGYRERIIEITVFPVPPFLRAWSRQFFEFWGFPPFISWSARSMPRTEVAIGLTQEGTLRTVPPASDCVLEVAWTTWIVTWADPSYAAVIIQGYQR